MGDDRPRAAGIRHRSPIKPSKSGGSARAHGKRAAGTVEEQADDWSWLDGIAGKLDDDFIRAVEEQPEPQRPPPFGRRRQNDAHKVAREAYPFRCCVI
jgi:hypothetical protein